MLGTLGGDRMDSRFRGNDERRSLAHRAPRLATGWILAFAGMTKREVWHIGHPGWRPCPGAYLGAVQVMAVRSFPPDKGGQGGLPVRRREKMRTGCPCFCHSRTPSVIPRESRNPEEPPLSPPRREGDQREEGGRFRSGAGCHSPLPPSVIPALSFCHSRENGNPSPLRPPEGNGLF